MIEIQCTSCHTRYRIDERVLPEDSPTFKCSRCGHVFTTNPVAKPKAEAPRPETPRPRIERPRREAPPLTPPPATEEPPAPKAEATPARPDIFAEQAEVPRHEAARPEVPRYEAPPSQPEAAAEPPHAPAREDSPRQEADKPSGDAPIASPQRPYIRQPRTPVFQPVTSQGNPMAERRGTAPESEEPEGPALGDVDDSAVARMKAAMAPAPPSARSRPRTPARSDRENADRQNDSGDNLRFDFDDDRPDLGEEPPERAQRDRWSVGDDIPYIRRDRAFGPPEPAPFGRGTIPEYAGAAIMEREQARDDLPDDVAFLERAAGLHSAGYFIGLFFFVAVVFTVLTLVICGAPSASADLLSRLPVIGPNFAAPTPLETMVAVSDIQAHYETVKGGHPALVLSGIAENTSQMPLHVIEIGVRLLDPAQHPLASSAVFCGNTLSAKMITEMTPHELEFLQKLDPQKNFVLEPSHSAPFLMVFIDPPRDVSRFSVAIARADPPAPEAAPAATASAHP